VIDLASNASVGKKLTLFVELGAAGEVGPLHYLGPKQKMGRLSAIFPFLQVPCLGGGIFPKPFLPHPKRHVLGVQQKKTAKGEDPAGRYTEAVTPDHLGRVAR